MNATPWWHGAILIAAAVLCLVVTTPKPGAEYANRIGLGYTIVVGAVIIFRAIARVRAAELERGRTCRDCAKQAAQTTLACVAAAKDIKEARQMTRPPTTHRQPAVSVCGRPQPSTRHQARHKASKAKRRPMAAPCPQKGGTPKTTRSVPRISHKENHHT